MRARAAISITAKQTLHDPVTKTLGTAAVKYEDSTLTAVRLSAGSSNLRALIEASNRRKGDPTESQLTLRRALGLDVAVTEGVWINLRYGRQRKISGSGEETGALMMLNIGPSALLKLAGS